VGNTNRFIPRGACLGLLLVSVCSDNVFYADELHWLLYDLRLLFLWTHRVLSCVFVTWLPASESVCDVEALTWAVASAVGFLPAGRCHCRRADVDAMSMTDEWVLTCSHCNQQPTPDDDGDRWTRAVSLCLWLGLLLLLLGWAELWLLSSRRWGARGLTYLVAAAKCDMYLYSIVGRLCVCTGCDEEAEMLPLSDDELVLRAIHHNDNELTHSLPATCVTFHRTRTHIDTLRNTSEYIKLNYFTCYQHNAN